MSLITEQDKAFAKEIKAVFDKYKLFGFVSAQTDSNGMAFTRTYDNVTIRYYADDSASLAKLKVYRESKVEETQEIT